MIDGESSKAELLQSSKCSSGDMTAVILTFTWSKSVKIWQKKTLKQQLKLDACTITLKELLLDKNSKLSIRDRRHEEIECETTKFDNLEISFKGFTTNHSANNNIHICKCYTSCEYVHLEQCPIRELNLRYFINAFLHLGMCPKYVLWALGNVGFYAINGLMNEEITRRNTVTLLMSRISTCMLLKVYESRTVLCTRTHTRTHARAHAHAHTHTHTHTHTQSMWLVSGSEHTVPLVCANPVWQCDAACLTWTSRSTEISALQRSA